MSAEFAEEDDEPADIYGEDVPVETHADESWMAEMGVKVQELRPAS